MVQQVDQNAQAAAAAAALKLATDLAKQSNPDQKTENQKSAPACEPPNDYQGNFDWSLFGLESVCYYLNSSAVNTAITGAYGAVNGAVGSAYWYVIDYVKALTKDLGL